MKTPRSVAVYARISSDPDGTELGVTRQLKDCRELCESLGWVIGDEYVDNDVSAYSGRKRPQFERMLVDIAERQRDAVVVYHQDRLARRPTDLERFLDVTSVPGFLQVRFVSGPSVDTGTGDGLLVLRLLGAVAASESATKSRRMKRKAEEKAATGRPHSNGRAPFGYESDGMTVNEFEAGLIRQMAARFLAGESLGSITKWIQDKGVSTRYGGEWRTGTIKQVIRSPRMAGLREFRGEVIGKAAWPAIITVSEHERINALISERAVSGRRPPRTHLLTGMLRCGRCEKRLYSATRERVTRRYVCQSAPDFDGCGRLTVVAAPLEAMISEAVLQRLDTPVLAETLAAKSSGDDNAAVLAEAVARDRFQLTELARVHGEGEITMAEWLSARKPIETRLLVADRTLARLSHTDALVGFAGTPNLRGRWAELALSRQQAIIKAVIDTIKIAPKIKNATQELDPARVSVTWRL